MSELEKLWFEKGRQQGLLEGIQQEKELVVLNLLAMGLKESVIDQVTGISSVEEIQYIINKYRLKSRIEKNPKFLSMSAEEISNITGISVEEIQKILKDETFLK